MTDEPIEPKAPEDVPEAAAPDDDAASQAPSDVATPEEREVEVEPALVDDSSIPNEGDEPGEVEAEMDDAAVGADEPSGDAAAEAAAGETAAAETETETEKTKAPARRRRRRGAAAEAAPAPEEPPAPAPQRRRPRRDPSLPPPVVRASARYVRSSPRKARLVCDNIRGKSVEEARAILAHTPRAIARDWTKLLESAVANAEHNHELVGEDLYVKAVTANDGPTIKRFQPRAMGRATKIRKRTSHLTILLTPKE